MWIPQFFYPLSGVFRKIMYTKNLLIISAFLQLRFLSDFYALTSVENCGNLTAWWRKVEESGG